jgi:Fic family protein
VPDLISEWERWVNDEHKMAPLIKCALIHYQFETIHPFLDGNGRLGRLLIILFLVERKVLTTPLLYLSAYFERNRSLYYDHLWSVSLTGDWAPWLEFFLAGVLQEANDAIERSRRVRALHLSYRDKLQKARQSGNTLRLLDEIFAHPIVTAPYVARLLGVTNQGARNVLERLTGEEILEPESGWPRFYVARELLDATAE